MSGVMTAEAGPQVGGLDGALADTCWWTEADQGDHVIQLRCFQTPL